MIVKLPLPGTGINNGTYDGYVSGSIDFQEYLDDYLEIKASDDISRWKSIGGGFWNTFHAWCEARINNQWYALDPTYNKGPLYRTDNWFMNTTDISYFIFGEYDGKRVDHLKDYRTRNYFNSMSLNNSPEKQTNLQDTQGKITISTSEPNFILGEEIKVKVRIENSEGLSKLIPLNISLERIFGTNIISVSSIERFIMVDPNSTIEEEFLFTKDTYKTTGSFVITVSSEDDILQSTIEVQPGYEVTTTIDKQGVIIGEPGKLTVNVKNVLDVVIPEIKVSLYVDPTSGGDRHIIYVINNLEPNQTYTETIDIKITKPIIPCYVTSDVAGNKYISTKVEVLKPSILTVNAFMSDEINISKPFTISAYISNEGDITAEGSYVNLIVPDGVAVQETLSLPLGSIMKSETKTVSWTVTVNRPGSISFKVVALDKNNKMCNEVSLINRVKDFKFILEPMSQRVIPGETTEYLIKVENLDFEPYNCKISVNGLPENWVMIESNLLSIEAGSEKEIRLSITPVRSSDTKPDIYDFTVNVSLGEVCKQQNATLEILPFHGVDVEITNDLNNPITAKPGSTVKYDYIVTNSGNVNDSYTIGFNCVDNGNKYKSYVTQIDPSWVKIKSTIDIDSGDSVKESATICVPEEWAGMENTEYSFSVIGTSKADSTATDSDADILWVDATKRSMVEYVKLEMISLSTDVNKIDSKRKNSLRSRLSIALIRSEIAICLIIHDREKLANCTLNTINNQMNAFINEVNAQRGKSLTSQEATMLINKANKIKDHLKKAIGTKIAIE